MQDITGTERPPVLGLDALRRRLLMLEADSDALLGDLALSAEAVVEAASHVVPQRRTYRFDAPPGAWRFWWFPVRPVVSVESVAVVRADGSTQALTAGTHYGLARGHSEPILQLFGAADAVRAGCGLVVEAEVGHAAGACPAPLLEAMGRLVKEWRDAYAATAEQGEAWTAPRLSMGARALMRQGCYRPPHAVWPV